MCNLTRTPNVKEYLVHLKVRYLKCNEAFYSATLAKISTTRGHVVMERVKRWEELKLISVNLCVVFACHFNC